MSKISRTWKKQLILPRVFISNMPFPHGIAGMERICGIEMKLLQEYLLKGQ